MMGKRKISDPLCHCLFGMLAVLLWDIFSPTNALADEIQFNADILDTNDRGNIDLKHFSRKGYIMPGGYTFSVLINNRSIGEHLINVTLDENSESGSRVCLSPSLVNLMGLKSAVMKDISWLSDGQCMDIASLRGMTLRPDLSIASLYINLPQAYLEYSDPNWEPPARWDDGIPATVFDYNFIGRQTHYSSTHEKDKTLSGNGIAGVNLGPWRFRSTWQMQANERSGNDSHQSQRSWEWSQIYAYRALRDLGAKLTVGEDYLSSSIFDSFRFTGVNLVTDDSMLPPNLRGYAPEVVGVARTNARVVISQQGRVIYESLVATGPFRIQTLSDSVSGSLDVRVEEQDGSVQQFTVETSTIPYLTRPGLVRYKVAAGKPSTIEHDLQGQIFSAGEFSWGVSNGWSLYGGAIGSGDYNALALGVGRDLLAFGALSVDVTESFASFADGERKRGGSYRLSYSKRFDELDNQITFAGYRFAERNFMTMSDYLNQRYNDTDGDNSKEMYTVTFNQQFKNAGISAYLKYSHQNYWDRRADDRLSVSISRYFDVGNIRNINASLTGYRNKSNGLTDDGFYATVSIPFNSGVISYNAAGGDSNSHTVGYYKTVDPRNSYQLGTGVTDNKTSANAYYTYTGDMATVNANVNAISGNYVAVGMGVQGGVTITPEGGSIHRISSQGGTRLMVDTGVGGVPVHGYGADQYSNIFGKAIVSDINSYNRNSVSVNINKLDDNVEASPKAVNISLTEGGVGYRKIPVVTGEKGIAIIRLADGSFPPFGAMVLNKDKQELGIITDDGMVYLAGIQPEHEMFVNWDGDNQCLIKFPQQLHSGTGNYLLPCSVIKNK